MNNKFPQTARPANTLSDIAALRRQLDEIERLERENKSGNVRLDQIKNQCDALQKDSVDKLSVTAKKQLHAYEDLEYVTKRTQEINQVMKALNNAESVDLCFLMDCTNSMQRYIEDVKNHIFETVELLKTRFPHLRLRLAFVGYRDLNLPKEKQFSILDFTDENEFHLFVTMVKCEYGADKCEDVLGGLAKVINLSWKQPVRILIHIGDAPSHGQRYHDLLVKHDHYLTYDADGSIGYSYIQEFVQLELKYYFGRLTRHTDKMIEQFCNYTEKQMTIEQIEVNNFTNLLPFIVESVSQSISKTSISLLKKHSFNDANQTQKVDRHRNIIFDETEPIWSGMQTKKLQVIKYVCNDDLRCEEIEQSWIIKIAENPFAEGGMRLAYYGLMQYKGRWEKVVFKEYKHIDSGANTKDKYLQLLDCQAVAEYLAQKFNQLPELSNIKTVVKKIKFIMTKLAFDRSKDGKRRNLTQEKFIEGTYKKFSNNAGFVDYNDPSWTLQAFSHWTYEHTNGDMMVVDLQGIDIGDNQTYLLTDPCIHSTDLKRFGGTNLGTAGMKRFFQTHVCNAICLALKLTPNKYQPALTTTKYDRYFVNQSKTVCQ